MRSVHIISNNKSVIGAIAEGLDREDALTSYPRALGVDHTITATRVLLDLGVLDGHDVGDQTLRTRLF